MDKKDEIILQQLDVIRTMTQNNLNRMARRQCRAMDCMTAHSARLI